MSTTSGAVRAPLAALALVSTLALAGCGDGDDDDDPGAAPSTGASTTSSDEPSASADEASPSASATTPSVAPATGPVMALRGMSLSIPEGWEISIDGKLSQAAFNAGGGPGAMSVTILGAVPGENFDDDAQSKLETMQSDGLDPQRLPDRTIGGAQAWAMTGGKKGVALEYQVGGVAGDDTFVIAFQFLTKPPADVMDTIDSVLASVTFDSL